MGRSPSVDGPAAMPFRLQSLRIVLALAARGDVHLDDLVAAGVAAGPRVPAPDVVRQAGETDGAPIYLTPGIGVYNR